MQYATANGTPLFHLDYKREINEINQYVDILLDYFIYISTYKKISIFI
jgi:hypothetical protein